MCYNNDTEAVLFYHVGDFDRHMAFTREGDLFESIYGSSAGTSPPRAKDGGNECVVISPDMMWGCAAFDVEITETGISYVCVPESEKEEWAGNPVVHTEQVITLYPHELLCTYTYEIRHVKNLAHVSQMCASLSGMAPSLLFGDESLGRECVTLPFEAHTADAQTITGGFLTFGHHEENAEPHRILGAMAALMMTACSQDEVVNVKQDGIDYSVVAGKQTRTADSYCNSDLPGSFKVWANADGELYINGDNIVRSGTSWADEAGMRYWPEKQVARLLRRSQWRQRVPVQRRRTDVRELYRKGRRVRTARPDVCRAEEPDQVRGNSAAELPPRPLAGVLQGKEQHQELAREHQRRKRRPPCQ